MKLGKNSDAQFEASGELHDSESSSVSDKYRTAPKVYEAFDPLNSEAADNKSYARPNIPISPIDMKNPIPEPIQQPPPPKPKEEPKPLPKEPITPLNPELSQLPPKEKDLAAKKAAQMAIMGYKVVHNVANWGVKINESQLKRLDKKKLIDLRLAVPTSPTETVPVIELVQEFNNEVGDAFSVSKEFEEEVTPILERIMNKRGIGATDEQMLIGIVAIDLAGKAAKFADLRKSRRDMINQLKDLTEAYKKGHPQPQAQNVPPQQQQAAQQQYQNQPQAQPQPAPQYQNQYTQPPTPPDFERDAEIAEIIPNEVDGEYLDVIPEPEYVAQNHDITEFQEETKKKRAYKKKENGVAAKKSTRSKK